MGALLDQWKNANQLFKTTARAKKPSPTLGTFASKTLGIEKALIKLEGYQAKGLAANPKALASWKSAAQEFRIVKTNYLVVLDGAIVPDPAGIITAGHDNQTARTVAVRQGEKINTRA